MSIAGAITELTKEIDHLNKEVERLTKMRDSLSQGYAGVVAPVATQPGAEQKTVQSKRKYTRSARPTVKTPAKSSVAVMKSATVKKNASVSAAAPASKRIISSATRKKMSDAAKARAAAKAEPAK